MSWRHFFGKLNWKIVIKALTRRLETFPSLWFWRRNRFLLKWLLLEELLKQRSIVQPVEIYPSNKPFAPSEDSWRKTKQRTEVLGVESSQPETEPMKLLDDVCPFPQMTLTFRQITGAIPVRDNGKCIQMDIWGLSSENRPTYAFDVI